MNDEQRKARIEKLREAGRKGGLATRKRRGKKYFKELGSRGGKASWKQDD